MLRREKSSHKRLYFIVEVPLRQNNIYHIILLFLDFSSFLTGQPYPRLTRIRIKHLLIPDRRHRTMSRKYADCLRKHQKTFTDRLHQCPVTAGVRIQRIVSPKSSSSCPSSSQTSAFRLTLSPIITDTFFCGSANSSSSFPEA